MADLSDVRDKLKTRLETVTGLRCFDKWPDQVNVPAAIVRAISMAQQALGGVFLMAFEVEIMTPLQTGMGRAQAILDGYLDSSGSASVRAALEGDKDLQSTVDTLAVGSWRDYGLATVNGVDYLGVTFDVEVWDS